MTPIAATILLSLCSSTFARIQEVPKDPVVDALYFQEWAKENPIATPSHFDEVISKTKVWSGTKFLKLASELRQLGKITKVELAESTRLHAEYFAKPANPMTRALFSKRLEPSDARPELYISWLYLLLKPAWPSVVEGPRLFCLSALLKCDEKRTLNILPEHGYAAPPQSGGYVNVLLNKYSDARGLAMVKEIFRLSDPQNTSHWSNTTRTLQSIVSRHKRTPWRKILEDELKGAQGRYAEGLREMLGLEGAGP